MPSYQPIELETDPDAIAQDAFDYIASKFPGYVPAEGHPMTVLIESQALQASIDRVLLLQALDDVFRRFGSLAGLPPLDPVAATVTSTWTMVDTAGYTIPAGAQVAVDDVGFRVVSQVVVAPGSSSTAAGGVVLQAVEEGAAANGLSGAAQPIDALAFVSTITLVGSSSGGSDGETTPVYMNRLAERLRLQASVAILEEDFAIMARDIAEVARAVAIDNYDADTATPGVEGHITVVAVDAAGQPIPTGAKNALKFLLEVGRVLPIDVHVIDPAYDDIDVDVSGVALPGFDAATVEIAVEAAISNYLSPANWGLPSSGDGDVNWINRDTVRMYEVAAVVNAVEGFDFITGLTINGGSADVTLTGGPVILTTPDFVNATVIPA